MQLGWRTAFLFMTREPGWRRKLLVGGALLLACPPLGWPLALGYRQEVALRLVHGREPVLPRTKRGTAHEKGDIAQIRLDLRYVLIVPNGMGHMDWVRDS